MSVLPGVLSRNWQFKVMAVAMAVLLWTVPRFEAQESRELANIPVRVQLMDPEWVLVGDPSPPSVSVTLSGSARDLIAIAVDQPPVQIPVDEVLSQDEVFDEDEVFAKDMVVTLRNSWFRGSERDGIVVENLRPPMVALRFERKVQQEFPFSIALMGQLPAGLSQSGPAVIVPRSTTVSGPSGRLEELDSLSLLPLDLAQVRGSGPVVQDLDTAGLRGLDIHLQEASVEVPTEETDSLVLSGLVPSLPELESDPQLEIRPTSVTVILYGPASLVSRVDPEDLEVTITSRRSTLAPGEETTTGVEVGGLPEWVTFRVDPPWIILLRPVGQ